MGQVTCSTITAQVGCGVILRGSVGGTNGVPSSGYILQVGTDTNTASIRKAAGNVLTTLTSVAYTPVSGDVVYGSVEGSVLTLKVNRVTKATFTDSTYTSGKFGVWAVANPTTPSRRNRPDVELDDFAAGGFITSDTFNIADETPLSNSGEWTSATSTCGTNCFQVVSNKIEPTTADRTAALQTASYPDDQWAQITCSTITANTSSCGLILRGTGGGANGLPASGYILQAVSTTNQVQLVRVDGSVQTTLRTEAYTPANGDVIYASVQGDWFTIRVNGVVKLQWSDTTYTSGKPGVSATPGAAGSDVVMDDFLAGGFYAQTWWSTGYSDDVGLWAVSIAPGTSGKR